MKRYEVWLNGQFINEYVRHGNALNKCFKLIREKKLDNKKDRLYIRDYITEKAISVLKDNLTL